MKHKHKWNELEDDMDSLIQGVDEKDFAYRLASAIDELKSSHSYFVMQQAYGEIGWDICERILDKILRKSK